VPRVEFRVHAMVELAVAETFPTEFWTQGEYGAGTALVRMSSWEFYSLHGNLPEDLGRNS